MSSAAAVRAGEVRGLVYRLLAQTKEATEGYDEAKLVPIVRQLSGVLAQLDGSGAGTILQQFVQATSALVPTIIGLIRKKMKALDYSQEEEVLRQQIPAFQKSMRAMSQERGESTPPPQQRLGDSSSSPARSAAEEAESDAIWLDWSYDEDNPPDDSEEEYEDDIVESMDQFSHVETYTSRVSSEPRPSSQSFVPPHNSQLSPSPSPPAPSSSSTETDALQLELQRIQAEIAKAEKVNQNLERKLAQEPKRPGSIPVARPSRGSGVPHQPPRAGTLPLNLESRKAVSTLLVKERKPSSSSPSRKRKHTAPTEISTPYLPPEVGTGAALSVAKEGWLLKLSPNTTLGRRFQKRYFILENHVLSYYRSPPLADEITKSLGQVRLGPSATIYQISNAESLQRTGHLHSENAFELRTSLDGLARTYFLVAPSVHDKKDWCESLSLSQRSASGGTVPANRSSPSKGPPRRDSLRSLNVKKRIKHAKKASKRYLNNI
eukprot:TRINITY_DN3738_c0_g1_i1.p1 TRINITY_DN3738_c0_g1~~TRINITY_DN3738_c0_g1_i1.p1  ORF type:complete len:491 (-),score=90.02 TRINITY_DN3738_c0_g1_i1:306-1778(-)